jgi:hypothetical protein
LAVSMLVFSSTPLAWAQTAIIDSLAGSHITQQGSGGDGLALLGAGHT